MAIINKTVSDPTMTLRDLRPGDMAVVKYDGVEHTVFVYRDIKGTRIVVSLNGVTYWLASDVVSVPVVKLYKKGDLIELEVE